ncbi:alpha/beta fold hydrolase [Actinomadura sp. 3N508]|uniref:alpha/beta fold hydrolase n=1 Tax=Actinomadura sp. 3N508 TaxID=3375153 RepID=UPI0037B4C507
MKTSPHERMVVDVEYAVADGERLLLDLYIPEGSGPHPVSLWVHGGAWLFGDRYSGATSFAAELAERGVAIASIDYRLGEAGAFPASIDDVRAAVRWLRAHGARHGLAIARIGAWGASAGGHLSLMAALDPRGDRIDAVVDFFGPTDLVARLARTELEREILPDPPDARYLRTTVKTLDRNRARAASPLYQCLDQAPPTLLVHGDRDQQIPLDQSLRMHQALVAAGRDAQLLVLGGAGHEDARFQQPWVLDTTAAFLRHHLTR